MGKCNCKVSGDNQDNSTITTFSIQNVLKYSAKIVGFLIGILLLPLIIVAIIWFMFDIMVLNKDVNLAIILSKIVKINKAILEDDEEEDEYFEYDENEEYITENVEEIK